MIGRSCERAHILENFNIVISGLECRWLSRSQPSSGGCSSKSGFFCGGLQQEQQIKYSDMFFLPIIFNIYDLNFIIHVDACLKISGKENNLKDHLSLSWNKEQALSYTSCKVRRVRRKGGKFPPLLQKGEVLILPHLLTASFAWLVKSDPPRVSVGLQLVHHVGVIHCNLTALDHVYEGARTGSIWLHPGVLCMGTDYPTG